MIDDMLGMENSTARTGYTTDLNALEWSLIGLILKVRVHAASLQDRHGATLLLDQIDARLDDLQLLWADGGYAGAKLAGWMSERFGARPLRLEIVRRSDDTKAFKVLPRRWVVESTFAWLHRFRRFG